MLNCPQSVWNEWGKRRGLKAGKSEPACKFFLPLKPVDFEGFCLNISEIKTGNLKNVGKKL